MTEKTFKITHPDLDGVVGEALESALPAWTENGWTVVDDGDSETAKEESVTPAAAPNQKLSQQQQQTGPQQPQPAVKQQP